jgi:hypothetical protein
MKKKHKKRDAVHIKWAKALKKVLEKIAFFPWSHSSKTEHPS